MLQEAMRCAGGVTWARRAVLFNVLFAWFGYSGVVYLAAHPDVLPPAGADLLGSFQVTVSAQTPAAVLSSPRTCGQHVPLCSIALVRGKQTIMDIFSRLRPSQQASLGCQAASINHGNTILKPAQKDAAGTAPIRFGPTCVGKESTRPALQPRSPLAAPCPSSR